MLENRKMKRVMLLVGDPGPVAHLLAFYSDPLMEIKGQKRIKVLAATGHVVAREDGCAVARTW
jgi:hypothetical protein